jgi:DNA-directed RNA polymerase I, II, and III subunit RPABC2
MRQVLQNSQHLLYIRSLFAPFLVAKHSTPKKSSAPRKTASKVGKHKKSGTKTKQVESPASAKKSGRPEDEVVVYEEHEYELREIAAQGSQVLIGPPWLTRFERARITGARSLQLSMGAPSLIRPPEGVNSSIMLAVAEIDQKALPISIRRILPTSTYQDIPIEWMRK